MQFKFNLASYKICWCFVDDKRLRGRVWDWIRWRLPVIVDVGVPCQNWDNDMRIILTKTENRSRWVGVGQTPGCGEWPLCTAVRRWHVSALSPSRQLQTWENALTETLFLKCFTLNRTEPTCFVPSDQSDQEKRVHDLSQKSVNCEEKIPDQDKTDKSEVNIQYLDSVIVTEDGLCRLHHMLAASASIASKYLIWYLS